jgi:hypothetical protein
MNYYFLVMSGFSPAPFPSHIRSGMRRLVANGKILTAFQPQNSKDWHTGT